MKLTYYSLCFALGLLCSPLDLWRAVAVVGCVAAMTVLSVLMADRRIDY